MNQEPAKMLNIRDLPQDHQNASVRLMVKLRQQYGHGAFLAGVQLNNLIGVIGAAYNEKNTVLRGAELERARALAQQIVGDVMAIVGEALGATPASVQAVAEALSKFSQDYEDEIMGEARIAETEGAAREVLAKIAQS